MVLFFACGSSLKLVEINSINHPYKFSQEIIKNLETSTESWKYQSAAWEYSYIGKYEEMLKVWDKEKNIKPKINQELLDSFTQKYKRKNAVDFITSQSDSFKILIINEAHHQPLHRVFTTELLKNLYKKGYRYLGLETLLESDTEINNRKYPRYSSGTYSIEPQFGNLIRKAIEIGFVLFAYEADGNGSKREIGQARNIERQIKKDSTAKYLIYCGFAHAAEGEYKSWGKSMAGRLHEFTGINPLTINQTEFTERSEDSLANPIFQKLLLKEASVFIDEQGNSLKYSEHPEWFDIMVFHPKTITKSNRPSWIFRNNRKSVKIELNEVELDRPFLTMAFKEKEDFRNAVPFDVVEAGESEKYIFLALEKGKYNLIFQNQDKKALMSKIEVK